MKSLHSSVGVLALCIAATACSSDPIAVQPDKNEAYTREFIKNFGVPADDHNYAMAQTAGLKVTTVKGGHVIVAANVKGENYLFADLDVPAGTHSIPVTLPRTVKQLQVVTDLGVHTVPTDAVVDIDKAPLDSRGGVFDIDKPTPDSKMNLVIDEEGGYPYLYLNMMAATRPYGAGTNPQPKTNEFLSQYFTPGMESTHNTNIETIYNPDRYTFSSASHETTFTCINADLVYYIFPIYWRAGLNEKDFKVYVHSVNEGDVSIVREKIRLPFNDEGDDEAGKPFPYLTYWDQSSFPTSLKYLTPGKENQLTFGSFKSDDGSFTEAYPKAKVANGTQRYMRLMSRGVKIRVASTLLDPEQYPNRNRHYHPAFGLAVEHTGKDGKKSFSSSCPWYNTREWYGNYYDMPLDELYLAGAATKSILYPNIPAYINDLQLYDYNRDGDNYPGKPIDPVHNTNGGLTTDGYSGHSWLTQIEAPDKEDPEKGDDYNKFQSSLPMLLGFSSAPTQKAQKDDRDYCDVIFLITPHYEKSVSWDYIYTKLHAYEWTIAAEDLGGSLDWDFNDVVFTFTDVIQNLKSTNHVNSVAMASGPASFTSMRVITVTPKAAGGTMPVYITYTGKDLKPMPDMPSSGSIMYSEANKALEDYLATTTGEDGTFILGTEVHKWLGAASHGAPVNAGAGRTHSAKQSVQFVIPTDKDVLEEDELGYLPGMVHGSKENKPLFGFAILVDKDNTLKVDAFADGGKGYVHMSDYTLGQDDYMIGVPDANGPAAPQMILVEGDWEWPREMVNIMDAYPSFADWVSNPDNDQWHKVKTDGKFTKK